MPSTREPLKSRLRHGPSLGLAWLALGSPSVAEIAAGAGAEAVVFDVQHGLWDRIALEMGIGLVAKRAYTIVRVAETGATAIAQALDAGADGIMVPLVETPEQAARAVSFALYPPDGERSGGGIRPLTAGPGYFRDANTRIAIGVMIETVAGVAAADAIAAVPGIDFVLIGTGDLGLSIGDRPDAKATHRAACARVLAACRTAGVACGIFTLDAEGAMARRAEGYRLVVPVNDIGAVDGAIRNAVRRFAVEGPAATEITDEPAARPPETPGRAEQMSTDLLAFAADIAAGRIRIVDLTQTLRPSTPVIQLPPMFAPSNPFRIEEISRYDERGPGWYWNNISCGEHTGTHFDAPIHWVTGKDLKNATTDTVPVQRFIAAAVVIDCSAEAKDNPDFLLEPEHIHAFEAKHGRIQPGTWVLMRTDWSKRTDPVEFLNMKQDGSHVPGPSVAVVTFLAKERDVAGWGVEAVGTDAGQAFAFEPAFPAHAIMHGSNKFGLASLTNLDQLPPTGTVLVTAPLKIENGSGSPLRVLALVAA
jgi:kynurenine formamidase/2-keto-3-deoxy-L-rhamnonate aldolase RhmA